MANQMTMNEANARIVELQREIEYLEPLVDSNLRSDLEIHIEEAPKSVMRVLLQELGQRQKELKKLNRNMERHQRETILDFDDEGADV